MGIVTVSNDPRPITRDVIKPAIPDDPQKCRSSLLSAHPLQRSSISLIHPVSPRTSQKSASDESPFIWQPPPPAIRYLRIESFTRKQARLPGYLDFSVVEYRANELVPLTERIRIDLVDPRFPVTIPFTTSNCHLVVLHYEVDPSLLSLADDFRAFTAKSISTTGLDRLQPGELVLTTTPFVPSSTLIEHILSSRINQTDVFGSLRVTVSDSPASPVRMTACDPIFPSPLLTVSHIALELGQELRECSVSLRVALFVPQPAGKPEFLRAYVDPLDRGVRECANTSSVATARRDDRWVAVFPDALHFVLEPPVTTDAELHIALFAVSRRRRAEVGVFTRRLAGAGARARAEITLKNQKTLAVMFDCLFPVVVSTPPELRECLENLQVPPPLAHDLYPAILPYWAQTRLTTDYLSTFGLAQIVFAFREPPKPLQVWIEHFFTPLDREFQAAFVDRVIAQIRVIDPAAMQIFLVVLKTMLIGGAIDAAALDRLFAAVARLRREAPPIGPNCLCCACKTIVQVAFASDLKVAQPIACRFLAQLEFADRCTAFRIFFADRAFLLMLFQSECRDPLTPYVPLVSLFYCDCYPVLRPPKLVTEREERLHAAKTQEFVRLCSVLVAGFEQYAGANACRFLFPLFAVVLEDFITLPAGLQERLLPLVWAAMRAPPGQMRRLYYAIFDAGTRAAVFEFLAVLWADRCVDAMVRESGREPQVFADEAVYRTVAFLGFLDQGKANADFEVVAIVRFVCRLLQRPLSRESAHRVFQWLTAFVGLNAQAIFETPTRYLLPLAAAAAQLAICGNPGHVEAVCFIVECVAFEKKCRPALTRSQIALQYAVGCECLTREKCNEFWRGLPKELDQVRAFLDVLRGSQTAGILNVLRLAKQYALLKHFPSMKVAIGDHIVRINELRNDLLAAFVAQWRVAALIADVLKLRGSADHGIPEGGKFPFIADSVEVDISANPKDSAYLVLEAESLTVAGVRRAASHALALSQRLMIPQTHYAVCTFMSHQLGLAAEVGENAPVDWLASGRHKTVGFVRMSLRGEVPERNGLTDLILAFARDKDDVTETVQSFCSELFGQSGFSLKQSHEAVPSYGTQDRCSFAIVKCPRDQLERFAVKKFAVDVKCPNSANWKDPIVRRYTFETAEALPSITSIALVTARSDSQVSKADYFEAKLGAFQRKLNQAYANVKAVLPPRFLYERWTEILEDIPTEQLLALIEKIRLASANTASPYGFVFSAYSTPPGRDCPAKIAEVAAGICKRIRRSVVLYDRLLAFRKDQEKDPLALQPFRFEPPPGEGGGGG